MEVDRGATGGRRACTGAFRMHGMISCKLGELGIQKKVLVERLESVRRDEGSRPTSGPNLKLPARNVYEIFPVFFLLRGF